MIKHWIDTNKYFLISLVLTALLFYNVGNLRTTNNVSQIRSEDHPLLASRLFGPLKDDIIINFTQLRQVIKERHAQKNLPIGIYFEYLPTGSSIGVNDQMEVEIGSLGKVPAVMAVYKAVEAGSVQLSEELTLKDIHLNDQFGTLWQKGAGYSLSVEEAIQKALVESDNTAINVLLDRIDKETPESVFDELDLPRETISEFPIMSPKSYSSVFRNLYLSAYLEIDHSEKILEYLTHTNFNDQLPAGLPTSVTMAHKIGLFVQDNGQHVFNDCGIVYVPKRPYVLCIMAATDEETARSEMIAYSKLIYSFVAQTSPSK